MHPSSSSYLKVEGYPNVESFTVSQMENGRQVTEFMCLEALINFLQARSSAPKVPEKNPLAEIVDANKWLTHLADETVQEKQNEPSVGVPGDLLPTVAGVAMENPSCFH